MKGDARGTVGFDERGDDVHGRALRGHDYVNAHGPCFLRETDDGIFHVFRGDHHQVGEFVDEHDEVRHLRLRSSTVVAHARQARLGGHAFVVGTNVATLVMRKNGVAFFHLADDPGKRLRSLPHVGDDRHDQMRDALVEFELDHLRIDHQKTNVFRRTRIQ